MPFKDVFLQKARATLLICLYILFLGYYYIYYVCEKVDNFLKNFEIHKIWKVFWKKSTRCA